MAETVWLEIKFGYNTKLYGADLLQLHKTIFQIIKGTVYTVPFCFILYLQKS